MKIRPLLAFALVSLLGMLPVAASAQPYVISADGSEVTDQKTGLIWRRCAEGMSYIGATCGGIALSLTHEAALQRAASQASSSGVAWRLPNVKELSSIADKSLSNPAIDAAAFPATPSSSYFWSSSPDVGNAYGAWSVSFGYGSVYNGNRGYYNYARLVRAGQ